MTIHKTLLASLCLTFFCLTLFSCSTPRTEEISDVQTIDPKTVRPGPIVHDTLSAKQIEQITKIQKVFFEVLPVSLDQTITDFKRDHHPDKEIAIWLAMATAYEKFVSKRSGMNLDKKKEVFKLILRRSMQNEMEARPQPDLKLLTDQEIAEIFSYYNLDGQPIIVDHK
jgi:hypothetical protein